MGTTADGAAASLERSGRADFVDYPYGSPVPAMPWTTEAIRWSQGRDYDSGISRSRVRSYKSMQRMLVTDFGREVPRLAI